jgi:hypothetical protein
MKKDERKMMPGMMHPIDTKHYVFVNDAHARKAPEDDSHDGEVVVFINGPKLFITESLGAPMRFQAGWVLTVLVDASSGRITLPLRV